jgi:hypothetical protein
MNTHSPAGHPHSRVSIRVITDDTAAAGVSFRRVITGGMTSTGQCACRTQYQLTDRCSS